MTPLLTPALIAEQLAICDAAGTIADPHFVKFNEAAFDHYRAALEMAAGVAELEAEVDRLLFRAHEDCTMKRAFDEQVASNKLLQIALEQSWADNTKLREALRFYGDEKSYEYGGDMGRALHSLDCDVVLDAGERARKALGE